MKGLATSINPLLSLYVYGSDFSVLNDPKRLLININHTIYEIMLNKKQIQGDPLVIKFGYAMIVRLLIEFGIKADPLTRNCMPLFWRCKKLTSNISS